MDIDLDKALRTAKTSAGAIGRAMSIWRYLDVEQGYAVGTKAPDGRPSNCVCQVNPDGREFWS